MKNKIKTVQEIVVDFVRYLESSKKNDQNLQVKLIEIMQQNALDSINKLNKMHKIVEANPELGKTAEEHVYKKLIEHVSRVQETIKSCLYREYLEYQAGDINFSSAAERKVKLATSEMLEIMSAELSKVLVLPYNLAMNPRKHWLNEQWKKADVALQMQMAINVLQRNPDDKLVDLCKTVVFSEKTRQPITKTTKKTIELTKAFPDAENEIHQSYYKSISAFEWNIPKNKVAKL